MPIILLFTILFASANGDIWDYIVYMWIVCVFSIWMLSIKECWRAEKKEPWAIVCLYFQSISFARIDYFIVTWLVKIIYYFIPMLMYRFNSHGKFDCFSRIDIAKNVDNSQIDKM